MLTDLRKYAQERQTDDCGWTLESLAYRPFIKAAESYISALFDFGCVSQISIVFEATREWLGVAPVTLQDFRPRLKTLVYDYMGLVKYHPKRITFAVDHLMAIVLKWPQNVEKIPANMTDVRKMRRRQKVWKRKRK
jgi:hypothetical protein